MYLTDEAISTWLITNQLRFRYAAARLPYSIGWSAHIDNAWLYSLMAWLYFSSSNAELAFSLMASTAEGRDFVQYLVLQ